MSIANKKLRPIPTSPTSGKYAKVDKLYGGLLRIVRNFEMDGGAENFPSNIEEYVFDAYGTPDGETTAPASVAPDPKYVFSNTYLEEQEIDKASGNQGSIFVSKLYQEAYDTIREIEKPVKTTDENGRNTTVRTYVILNSAPEENKELGVTPILDEDDPNQVATTQQIVVGNAVSIIKREFIEATDTLDQVGGDRAEKDENDKWTLTRDYIGTLSAPIGDQEVGVSTTTYDGKTLILFGLQVEPNATVQKVRKIWKEKQILSVVYDRDSKTELVGVTVLGEWTAAEVRSVVSEITLNHSLKNVDIANYEGFQANRYNFEIRSTDTLTELGDPQIGVEFDVGIQTDGTTDFIITREYAISSGNLPASIVQLLPPAITDPVFNGTGDNPNPAYIVDQEIKPNGQEGATIRRVFAMVPTPLVEWDEMVVPFPGVEKGPFQIAEDFPFRSEPYSEAVPVRICRTFYLSNPQRICRPEEFRPVDSNGNRVTVLTDNTVPTADEYIGYVNAGQYLVHRVSIHRWQGDIWERRVISFKAE